MHLAYQVWIGWGECLRRNNHTTKGKENMFSFSDITSANALVWAWHFSYCIGLVQESLKLTENITCSWMKVFPKNVAVRSVTKMSVYLKHTMSCSRISSLCIMYLMLAPMEASARSPWAWNTIVPLGLIIKPYIALYLVNLMLRGSWTKHISTRGERKVRPF